MARHVLLLLDARLHALRQRRGVHVRREAEGHGGYLARHVGHRGQPRHHRTLAEHVTGRCLEDEDLAPVGLCARHLERAGDEQVERRRLLPLLQDRLPLERLERLEAKRELSLNPAFIAAN